MNLVRTHPVDPTSGSYLSSDFHNFGKYINLDISKLASPRSLFFSQCIKNILKLVLCYFMTIGQIWKPAHSDIQNLNVSSDRKQGGWSVTGLVLIKWMFWMVFPYVPGQDTSSGPNRWVIFKNQLIVTSRTWMWVQTGSKVGDTWQDWSCSNDFFLWYSHMKQVKTHPVNHSIG